jgi:Uma2 family endonuclease
MSSSVLKYQKILDAHRWRVTTGEYLRMVESGTWTKDDNVELIRGEIINMSPINSQHAGTVKRIKSFLERLLYGKYIIGVQDPIEIPEHSMPQPDITIARYRDDYYTSRHPQPQDILLIIEVADTSLPVDKFVKEPLYAEANIPEYWIVDLQRKCIEVHKHPIDAKYTNTHEYQPDETFRCELVNGDIRVADLLIIP